MEHVVERFLKKRFTPSLFKNLFWDLEDQLRAAALKAHNMVREHSP
jgi:hypothetical protein